MAIALYLFLLTAVRALRAEVRARTTPFRTQTATVTRSAARAASRPPARPAAERPVEIVPRDRHDRLEVIAYEGDGPSRS